MSTSPARSTFKHNAFDMSAADHLPPATRALVERRRQAFGPTSMLFYDEPVHFVRGAGVHLYDAEGNAYLDAYNNVPSVGHCHPHVVEAIARQAATLNTHTRYLYDIVYTYAEKLLATLPPELSNVVFTNSGTESNDLALRIVRAYTGGDGFIVTENAYHGHSVAVTEITPSLGPSVPIGKHVRTVPAPNSYLLGEANVAEAFRASVVAAIADLERHGYKFGGMMVDGVFSSDGTFVDPAGFLKPTVDAVHAAGGLFIADEVQPGFGRTGEAMWGFMRHGFLPDMVTMGKPMGNGLPMGATVVKPEILAVFGKGSGYFNTFGGNPVACAAGIAVLEVIENEGLIENARKVGQILKDGFKELAGNFTRIGDVRGAGLFVGVEFVTDPESKTPDPVTARRVTNGLRQKQVLISCSGAEANVLKVRPPLPFTAENAATLLEKTSDVLKAL